MSWLEKRWEALLSKLGRQCREVIKQDHMIAAEKAIIALRKAESIGLLAKEFSALSNEIRLKIVVALAAAIGKESSSITYYLKVLKDCKIIEEERRGKFSFYRLNREKLRSIAVALKEMCCAK